MFTAARICFALNTALAGAVVSMTAAHAPTWAIIVCGAATAFTGGLLAFSGPVQAGSGDKVTVTTPVKP
jgi:hypothetical protein